MLASLLVYFGGILAFLGGVSFLKPLTFLGIGDRRKGALIFAAGIAVAIVGFAYPARETRIAAPRTRLDQFMPVYQFNEIHSMQMQAPCDRVYTALNGVTVDEIALYRTLTWVRRFGRSGEASMMNPPAKVPLLELAVHSGFLRLAEEPGREIVLGTAVAAPPGFRPSRGLTPEDFKTLHAPGFALAAMNFRVEDAGPGACTVTTETRVFATDASTKRRFARYWRLIYPGSALLRRMWLRAVKRRAESRSRGD